MQNFLEKPASDRKGSVPAESIERVANRALAMQELLTGSTYESHVVEKDMCLRRTTIRSVTLVPS